jgi:6-phosphogluconolactonase
VRDILVVPTRQELADRVAGIMADRINDAITDRARAVVAFSGGTTPAPMLRHLAGSDVDWTRVVIFQVDERVAPGGHDDRNATMLARELLDHVPATTYLMPVTDHDLRSAAAAYASLLGDVCGGVLDVVHLGLGADGHTASLVPGDAVLDVTDADVAVTGEYQGRRRMTLTAPAINRARSIVWEVAGGEKALAVRSMLDGRDVPGALISQEGATLVLDAPAAALLDPPT